MQVLVRPESINPLELELWTAISHLTWGLETEPGFPVTVTLPLLFAAPAFGILRKSLRLEFCLLIAHVHVPCWCPPEALLAMGVL